MIWFYYFVFFLGATFGLCFSHNLLARSAKVTLTLTSSVLLFLFGQQFSAGELFRNSMAEDLVSALVLASAAVIGSVAITYLLVISLEKIFKVPLFKQDDKRLPRKSQGKNVALWLPLVIFTVGMFFGYKSGIEPSSTAIKLTLYILIASVGVEAGAEILSLKQQRPNFTLATFSLLFGLPISIIGGSLLFSIIASLFLPLSWRECMLSVAPMGWQTLGGPMVMDIHSVRLGNQTFIVNMLRDSVSLLLIPILCLSRHKILGVAPGGVSTMDILLPVYSNSAGKSYMLYAMWVGASCSFWAPILVLIISSVFF